MQTFDLKLPRPKQVPGKKSIGEATVNSFNARRHTDNTANYPSFMMPTTSPVMASHIRGIVSRDHIPTRVKKANPIQLSRNGERGRIKAGPERFLSCEFSKR